ncbi:hypothetical protein MSC49_40900 (plasmid) [Methylosinus sp. C49]|nr:hypothetical protein MSC49_40900 [Methylosinus sp. C49]
MRGKRDGAVRHVTPDDGVDADSTIIANGYPRVDSRAHADHAPLSNAYVACQCRVGQKNAEVADYDAGTQYIVREQMDVSAEDNIGHDRERTDICTISHLSVGRNDRRGMDDTWPPAPAQGWPLADRRRHIRIGNGEEGVNARSVNIVDGTYVMPEHSPRGPIVDDPADSESSRFEDANKVVSIPAATDQKQTARDDVGQGDSADRRH